IRSTLEREQQPVLPRISGAPRLPRTPRPTHVRGRGSPDPIRGSDNDRGGVVLEREVAGGQSTAEGPSGIPCPGWYPPLREMREADALRSGAARRQAGWDAEGVPVVPVPPVQASNPARHDPPVGGSSVPG